jgi:hypothetical protein
MKNRSTAWIAISLASVSLYLHTGSSLCAVLLAFILAALLTPLHTFALLRDNTVDAELNLNRILDSAISAFKRAVFPVTMFASVFRNVQLSGTNKIGVPYYPLENSASRDFDQSQGYVFDDDSATQVRDVTIDKRKYQPLHFTSDELARLPLLNAERMGQNKGEKLAYDVLRDILSVITVANYGPSIFGGDAEGFDSDNVIDIRTALNKVPWPETGRGLMLNSDYDGALLKDNAFKAAYALGTDQAIRTGRLPNVLGFEYASSSGIPDNSENLVGFAAYMSAILLAFSPIEPAESIRKVLVDYQIATDPATGISLEYRHWGDPDMDTDKRVIECNYGYNKGETAALKRITSEAEAES